MSETQPNTIEQAPKQSRPVKLDKIDRRILASLQEDGRMTNVDLAKRAGISAPPCLRRVRNLEDSGLILSYHARVNAGALGYPMTVFAHVKLSSVGEGELKKFEAHLSKWDRVREVYLMTGDSDFLLKVVAKDWDDYQDFLTNKLLESANIASVKSSLSIKTSKYAPGVPIFAD